MDYKMDVFIEHRVVKKKSGIDWLKVAGITVGGIILVFVVFFLTNLFPSMVTIALLLELGVAYLWWHLISGMNVEYEYALTNGDLDIDKIIAKRRRKRLITVDLRQVEVFAPVFSPDHKREFESPNFKTRIDASASPLEPGAYFFTVSHDKTGLTRVIFTPSQKILDGAHKAAPRKVFLQ